MKTRLYPMLQFKKDTWEIDEFECASVFVLVGREKAMVIDAGIGIGDLIGAIRMTITDKPLVIVATHGHGDHTGGMGNFDEYYLSEKDWFYPVEESIEMRRGYSAMIAKRQGGYYPWVADRDITPFEKQPRRLPLEAGVEFDLGGRIIKTIACPDRLPRREQPQPVLRRRAQLQPRLRRHARQAHRLGARHLGGARAGRPGSPCRREGFL